jgi:hypothetical protein
MEYVLDVKDESLSNPKIEFRKADGCSVRRIDPHGCP